MSQSCVVRQATTEDIDWLIEECAEFGRFFDSKIPLYNEEHLRSVVLPSLINSHLFLVAEVRGEKAGFIAGLYTSHFLNPLITTLTEILFWVTPKLRGSRAAIMLIEAYTQWGKLNADWISMTVESASHLNEKSILKRGFRFKEKSYFMEVGV